MSWHVPCEEEIEFALDIFRELVKPTLEMLEALLETGSFPQSMQMTRN